MSRFSFPTRFARLLDCWSALLLHELVRQGVRDCCIAPGSRSTPLTLAALAEPGLDCHRHFDERGLGFYALGLAKQSARPVILITTSGSAVANLYPALIEAAQTGVALIVLAADRPPELIGCGANQAIEQGGIFAGYPVWQRQLPVPTDEVPPQVLLSWVDEAVVASRAGPVLFNCPFREPFYPEGDEQDFSGWLAPVSTWREGERPWSRQVAPLSAAPLQVADFFQSPGLIVVGALQSAADAEAVLELGRQSGWPILADPQSGLGARHEPLVLTGLDLLLQQDQFVQALAEVRHLLQIGSRLVAKRLQQWLAQHDWQQRGLLTAQSGLQVPDMPAQLHWCGEVAATLAGWSVASSGPGPALSHWLGWQQRLLSAPEISESFNELAVVRAISQQSCGALMLGNSLPIRLYEQLADGALCWQPRYANRGASGIDGLLATSAGIACSGKDALTLLVGDLAFLHDLNSLALCRASTVPLVVVLLNNDGGAIFNLLPVPQDEEVQAYYRCSHGLTMAAAAELFGLEYARPESLLDFRAHYDAALTRPGCSLIEVVTPAGEATALLQQLGAKAAREAP